MLFERPVTVAVREGDVPKMGEKGAASQCRPTASGAQIEGTVDRLDGASLSPVFVVGIPM